MTLSLTELSNTGVIYSEILQTLSWHHNWAPFTSKTVGLKVSFKENSYRQAHWDDESESGSGSGSDSEDEECYIHADLDANEYLLKIDPGVFFGTAAKKEL